MAGVGAKAGGQYALHRARKVFASAERHAELDAAFELQTAESIAEALGNMKGAMMKLGQMASYLDQGLPEPVREALAELQAERPADERRAGRRRSSQRGARARRPRRCSPTWDPKPIAAASIGQVHRAITNDGRAVAVKVQYPGVGDAIRADLDNAGLLFGAMGMLFPGLEPGPLVEELRDAAASRSSTTSSRPTTSGCSPTTTAATRSSTCPRWSTSCCAERVLTTELAEGVALRRGSRRGARTERDLAAEAIFRFVFGSLYRLHAFNGDPHPGNYLFQPGGQVTFLDFGLVKRFDPDEVRPHRRRCSRRWSSTSDIKEYRRLIESIGMLKPGNAVHRRGGRWTTSATSTTSCSATRSAPSPRSTRRRPCAGSSTTAATTAEIMKAANVPPDLRDHPAHQPRPLRHLRPAPRHRQLAPHLRGDLAVRRTARRRTEMGERAAAWAAERGHR